MKLFFECKSYLILKYLVRFYIFLRIKVGKFEISSRQLVFSHVGRFRIRKFSGKTINFPSNQKINVRYTLIHTVLDFARTCYSKLHPLLPRKPSNTFKLKPQPFCQPLKYEIGTIHAKLDWCYNFRQSESNNFIRYMSPRTFVLQQ